MPIFSKKEFKTCYDRCEMFAKYIIENNATVRETAAYFGISKSTVHKDVTEKLYMQSISLYEAVRKILDINKSERHLRGGSATKRRYENLKLSKKNV